MQQISESFIVLAVYTIQLGAIIGLTALIIKICDLVLAQQARDRRRAERRERLALERQITDRLRRAS